MSMRRKMASSATFILWALVVVFLVGVVLWSIPGNMRGGGGRRKQTENTYFTQSVGQVVATVNGHKITANELDDLYAQRVEGSATPMSVTIDNVEQVRKAIFSELVQQRLVDIALRDLHIWASGGALRNVATTYAAMQVADLRKQADDAYAKQQADAKAATKPPAKDAKKPKTADEFFTEQLDQYVQSAGGPKVPKLKNPTEKQFTRWMVNDFLMNKDGVYDQFRNYAKARLIGQSLIKGMPVNPTSDAYLQKLDGQDVKASWIFIAAKKQTPAGMAEAQKTAQDLHDKVVAKTDTFEALARSKSDDMMTRFTGGSLDWVQGGRSQVALMAEYLAYSTDPGKLSPVMPVSVQAYGTSKLGYAFVRVEKVRPHSGLAKDYDWMKERERVMLDQGQRYESEMGNNYLELLKARADIQIMSPELKVYFAMGQDDTVGADKERENAMKNGASLPRKVQASFAQRLATQTPDLKKRAEYLELAISEAAGGSSLSQMHLELGKTYASPKLKRTKDAIDQLNYARETAEESNTLLRQQVLDELKKLGDTKDAAEVADWLSKHKSTAPQGSPMMMPPR